MYTEGRVCNIPDSRTGKKIPDLIVVRFKFQIISTPESGVITDIGFVTLNRNKNKN